MTKAELSLSFTLTPQCWEHVVQPADLLRRRAVGFAFMLGAFLLMFSGIVDMVAANPGLTLEVAAAGLLLAGLGAIQPLFWRGWMRAFQFHAGDEPSAEAMFLAAEAARIDDEIAARLRFVCNQQGGLYEFQISGAFMDASSRQPVGPASVVPLDQLLSGPDGVPPQKTLH